jgi:FkbM family methyltransferase
MIKLKSILTYYLFPSIQTKRVKPWFQIKGDYTLRLDYDLNENSIVFDLGGYKGEWTYEIFNRYRSNIYIFEPNPHFCEAIRAKFRDLNKIKVFEYGLSDKDSEISMSIMADSSSFYKEGNNKVKVKIIDVKKFLNNNGINKIDLMKINIEGAEYDLLEYMLEKQLVEQVENLQIQFHDFVPNSYKRMKNIQSLLSKTHFTTYSFEYVWENWKLKNAKY